MSTWARLRSRSLDYEQFSFCSGIVEQKEHVKVSERENRLPRGNLTRSCVGRQRCKAALQAQKVIFFLFIEMTSV